MFSSSSDDTSWITGYFLLSLSVDEKDSGGILLEQLSAAFSSFILIPSFHSPEPAAGARQKYLQGKFLHLLLIYQESVMIWQYLVAE